MISRKKEYLYKPDKLIFEENKITFRKKWLNLTRFFGLTSSFAFVLILFNYFLFETPANVLRTKKLKKYINEFANLNIKLDSLENILLSHTVKSDNIYRAVLNLDTLPTSVRNAGIGGSASNIIFKDSPDYSEKILGNLDKVIRQLKIQQVSFDTLQKEAIIFDKKLNCIPGIQPVKPNYNIWISSYFGSRTDPFTHTRRSHRGIDFVGPTNCNIYATADGTVTLAKHSRKGYGNEIVISHGFGYSTLYGHLNKILVREGEQVKRGQLIGLMGSTGRSTGVHLHYEVRLYNIPVNPLFYYENDLSTKEYEMITKNIAN